MFDGELPVHHVFFHHDILSFLGQMNVHHVGAGVVVGGHELRQRNVKFGREGALGGIVVVEQGDGVGNESMITGVDNGEEFVPVGAFPHACLNAFAIIAQLAGTDVPVGSVHHEMILIVLCVRIGAVLQDGSARRCAPDIVEGCEQWKDVATFDASDCLFCPTRTDFIDVVVLLREGSAVESP